jgi:hypothetical protein
VIMHVCLYCQQEYRARHSVQRYCSRSCRNKSVCIGSHHSDEHRSKISISTKGKNAGENNPAYGKTGESSWTYGTRRTDECKQRLSEAKKGLYLLENNPNWKGGKSFEPYPLTWTKELKTRIRQRDGFTCQICGKNGFTVHHKDYDKDNCSEDNLITLCKKCHPKTNHNREKWIEFFRQKQVVGITQ